jgi:hypothetical protein
MLRRALCCVALAAALAPALAEEAFCGGAEKYKTDAA